MKELLRLAIRIEEVEAQIEEAKQELDKLKKAASLELVNKNKLTAREQEVWGLVHLQDKEIAAKLHISVRTVKYHVSRLLDKFGVESRRRKDLP